MCGIAGSAGRQRIPEKRWEAILDVLGHRGPDDRGLYRDQHITLAHTRLSILDLSPRGHQPMISGDGRYVIVHNGEIYNYVELRSELAGKGYEFRSRTDTEVILCSYREWGEECLSRFNGMFAFALWDTLEHLLFFARDRLGEKPFYYSVHNGSFCFASEIKALLEMDLPPRAINLEALAYYLQFRHNDLEETIFKGIFKLPPGHMGLWADGRLQTRPYWQLEPGRPHVSSEEEMVETVYSLLRDSVRLRLRSDVPVGLFLSGGVDSSGLLAAMSAEQRRPVETFNADMEGLSATRNIEVLTSRMGSIHHTLKAEADITSLWPAVVRAYDELNADPASLPMFELARMAGSTLKVIFSGEGADEIFAGYERISIFLWAYTAHRYLPAWLLGVLPDILGRVPPRVGNLLFRYFSIIVPEGIERFRDFIANLSTPRRSYLAIQSILLPEETMGLLLPEHRAAIDVDGIDEHLMGPFFRHDGGREAIEQILLFEIRHRMVSDLLMKCDAMTMAHGLECRVPYLDHRLVEYAMQIPLGAKVRWGKNKVVLRKALGRLLPASIANQAKENFFPPIHLWLNELRPWVAQLLDERHLLSQGIFEPARVAALLQKYRAGNLYYARQLWNLMNFQLWHRIYMEPEAGIPQVRAIRRKSSSSGPP